MKANRVVLLIFAPILILTGIAGFVIPANASLTSGATPYNIFHIVFGLTGLILVLARLDLGIVFFNIGFGLIDLYQAVASKLDLFPRSIFLWTPVDDVLHVVIGVVLVGVGIYGLSRGASDGAPASSRR